MKGPWMQELMWVRRNESGIAIDISEKPPVTGDMIPNLPRLVKKTTEADPQTVDAGICSEVY